MKLDLLEIQKPISETATLGTDLSQSLDFEWLDTELMKVGSLTHESIEWEKIEKLSWKILTKESKDYRVLSFFIQALLQKNDFEYLQQSITLIQLFLEHHWLAYPYDKETPRVKRNRQRFLAQILKRILQKVEEQPNFTISEDDKITLNSSLNTLKEILQQKESSLDELEQLMQIFDHLFVRGNNSNQAEKSVDSVDKEDNSKSASDTKSVSILAFLKSEKDDKLAYRLIEQCEKNEEFLLAIIIRRLLLWDGIKELPVHDNEGETTISSPSQETISKAHLLLSSETPSIEDWEQLEVSLMKAPFWLDAHHASAIVASKLFSVAHGVEIKNRVKAFLKKFPQLKTLTFSNGIPYLSEKTLTWIENEVVLETFKEEDLVDSPANMVAEETFYETHLWNSYLQEADKLYTEEGFSQALHGLHQKIEQSINLREKVLWQLSLSQLYQREKLPELALHNNQTIMTQLNDINLSEWEPQIFELLQKKAISKN